jgi:CheY-like chemotaxis protein
MSTDEAPCVLCVDDEPRVLEGLTLHLRKDYKVHCATSAAQALQKMRELGNVAVVVSDMRMPGMDGATLLHQVMVLWPQATRILLTGEPGRETAVSAVNKGNIFRFLTKPCPPDQLKAAVEAGVIQHRLFNAERAILQETVLGCIQVLIDVLAFTNPVAFGRASRVKRAAMDLAAHIGAGHSWQLEAAAMLSQLGYLSLPLELVEKIYYGEKLTADETTLAEGVPKVAIRLLEHIPRLEPVLQILTALNWTDEQIARLGDGTIGLATRILGLVLEYDSLITQGHSVDVALQSVQARSSRYQGELIEHLVTLVGGRPAGAEARELPLSQVLVGMTLLQEVRTQQGTLLVPRGFEVTTAFLERIPNFGPELLAEKVRVLVPTSAHRKAT